MNELVLVDTMPKYLIVPTADLVENFHRELLPLSVKDSDVREIINQISDVVDTPDREKTLTEIRRLPNFDGIASKHFLQSLERQHLLKSAIFNLGSEFHKRLIELGVFESPKHRGEFPYLFSELIRNDAAFFLLPY
ncbi:MAG: hypothetical protein P4L77_11065 [Sulfuriferula sp.]|nr:hypothetical protein [Sulfuriferula sp.]